MNRKVRTDENYSVSGIACQCAVFRRSDPPSPSGCRSYANDASAIGHMRDSGKTEEEVVNEFTQHKGVYSDDAWPHVLLLIERVYKSQGTAEDIASVLFGDCMEHQGWIDRPNI